MTTPLVSVVIPTHNRPQFLPRAVESALACQGPDVEVIVVPNGPDESWKASLARWKDDSRVRVSPIETAHGNVARNHGMTLARGKFIRFLDDDDYLLPAAAQQLALLEQSGADFCSGRVENVDDSGQSLGLVGFPETRDFVCAAASISGFTLPLGNLFRADTLMSLCWDESVARAQDYAWMLDLALCREWSWVHCKVAVGVWFQHAQPRVSSMARLTHRPTDIIDRLVVLHGRLHQDRRASAERDAAIANGLWYYLHRGFPNHPIYWTRIAKRALTIAPASRPPDRFYTHGPFRRMNPVLGEWVFVPVRRVTRLYRDARLPWRNRDHRRVL